MAKHLIFLFIAAAAALRCDSTSAVSGRKGEIRRVIDENLHFHIHCWCLAPDERTVRAVLAVANEGDAEVLGELLSDPKPSVALGAQSVLIALAAADLERIRPNVPRSEWLAQNVLEKSAAPSVRVLRKTASDGLNGQAKTSAIDALIEIEITERSWRASHPSAVQE
jgi:hypothetical protein